MNFASSCLQLVCCGCWPSTPSSGYQSNSQEVRQEEEQNERTHLTIAYGAHFQRGVGGQLIAEMPTDFNVEPYSFKEGTDNVFDKLASDNQVKVEGSYVDATKELINAQLPNIVLCDQNNLAFVLLYGEEMRGTSAKASLINMYQLWTTNDSYTYSDALRDFKEIFGSGANADGLIFILAFAAANLTPESSNQDFYELCKYLQLPRPEY